MKKIKVVKGDEYRAKKETNFDKESFFADVYRKAEYVLDEILQEMEKFQSSIQETCTVALNYHGMGNNIIAFCAARGYGKTSALRTFSYFLENNVRVCEDQSCAIDKVKYVVLDSIDPSFLDSGESIVRVMISRLFFRFNQYVQCESNKNWSFLEEDKRKLLLLFQECFDNIDYLQKDKSRDNELDDLNYLAQLGNSGKLKENLYKLVESFLKIILDGTEKKYLVITIDDADLSMGDTFKICEDIRNYFSIPNVVVLLAANYEQLYYAIFQKYLERYKILLDIDEKRQQSNYRGISDERRDTFFKKCTNMTSKYLEKMLPSGHRIDLPQVENVLVTEHQDIKVAYIREGKDVLDDATSQCRDIQEQILKLIYQKTGIVFLKTGKEYHPFMPQSMRELTHLLKLLYEMHSVPQQGMLSSEQLIVLRDNLDKFKRYFLDYWCVNRLKNRENSELFQKIDELHMAEDTRKVVQKLDAYIPNLRQNIGEECVSYQALIELLAENHMEAKEENFYHALRIYYTIYLNERFVRSYIEEDATSLIRFIRTPIYWPKDKKFTMGGYQVVRFDIDFSIMRQFFPTSDDIQNGNAKWALEHFCSRNNDRVDVKDIYPAANSKYPEEVQEVLAFYLYYPVLFILNDIFAEEKGQEEEQVRSSDQDFKNEKEQNSGPEMDQYEIYTQVKKILANYDVQGYIKQEIMNKFEELKRKKEIYQWAELFKELYGFLDKWMEECAPYLGETCHVGKELESTVPFELISTCFLLSNRENLAKYKKDYNSYLEGHERILKEYERQKRSDAQNVTDLDVGYRNLQNGWKQQVPVKLNGVFNLPEGLKALNNREREVEAQYNHAETKTEQQEE